VRTVFLGTPALAVPALELLSTVHDVAAVVCQPDRPQGRSGTPVPPPTKAWAVAHGIPVYQPTKLNNGEFAELLKSLQVEIGIVFAYGRILQQPILDIPPLGWLNIHPSLLPRWRGPSPIQSALIAGDEETGVSIMRLVLEMDAGDIVLQSRTHILPQENAEELGERLSVEGARLLVEAMAQVEAGTAVFTPQADGAVTHCAMLGKEDGYVRWASPASNIHNLVRGAYPWPAAQTEFRGEHCRILQSEAIAGNSDAAPGTIVALEKDRTIVATGDGLLALLRFQFPGKKAMPMGDFIRGAHVRAGECFGDIPDAG